jgi:4-carboxymuconolactone decarboxylase
MRLTSLSTLAFILGDPAAAQPQAAPRPSGALQQRLAPGLADYTDEVLYGQVWPGQGLSQRDRSLAVVAALIATNKPAQLRGHLGRALANGVSPVEASGVLTHLALYSGWPNAVSALEVYDQVYTASNIDFSDLAAARAALAPSPADVAEGQKVTDRLGAVAPGFARLTNTVLLGDLWRRSDLTVRDRSLVTIAALAAMGEADQLAPYVNRGIEAGLTRAQIGEALTHLAFYAGWPRATKALEAVAAAVETPRPAAAAPVSAPSANFTGAVAVTGTYRGTGGSRIGGATVTFAPSARTHWHSHPVGQLLVVTAGQGWMQIRGEPAQALRPGDVVWTPPGVRHWHGAARASGLSHVAVSEEREGAAVQWFEPVSEADFQAAGLSSAREPG